MNPERAAAIFKELLMTPVAELDQLPRRCGLQGTPRPDDLEHARELLRAILVGLESQPGPNWDPIHTAWGAMVSRHGAVQESAMGPEAPEWVRNMPAKPSLGDAPPGAAGPAQPYASPPAGPPPMAPVPMGQPPMPMGPPAAQPMRQEPPVMAAQHVMPVPAPIPAHERGPRPVARTEPGLPAAPPPPGREAWPQPPAALHGGGVPAPVGHMASDAAPVYQAPQGYPQQQTLSPAVAQPGYPVAPQPGYPVAPQAPADDPRASYPPAQPSYPSQPSPQAPAPQAPAPQAIAPQAPGREPAKTSLGDDIAMNVAKYAAFCAACAAHPDSVFQTMVEYGVNSPQAREALDESWQDRFDDDPTLQARWEELFSNFRSQY